MPKFEFSNRRADLITFDKNGDFFPDDGLSDEDKRKRAEGKKKEKEEELKLQQELISKGKEFGNHFEFVNPKLKLSKFDLPKGINKDIFDLDANQETLEKINNRFQDIEKFLSAPIILDKFDSDHVARREWEDKYLSELSPEAKEYYNSNRLGLNHANKIIPFWGSLEIMNEDSELKMKEEYFNKLDGLMGLIPKSIYNLEPLPYAALSIESKVRDIEELSLVILAFVRILGEPRKE